MVDFLPLFGYNIIDYCLKEVYGMKKADSKKSLKIIALLLAGCLVLGLVSTSAMRLLASAYNLKNGGAKGPTLIQRVVSAVTGEPAPTAPPATTPPATTPQVVPTTAAPAPTEAPTTTEAPATTQAPATTAAPSDDGGNGGGGGILDTIMGLIGGAGGGLGDIGSIFGGLTDTIGGLGGGLDLGSIGDTLSGLFSGIGNKGGDEETTASSGEPTTAPVEKKPWTAVDIAKLEAQNAAADVAIATANEVANPGSGASLTASKAAQTALEAAFKAIVKEKDLAASKETVTFANNDDGRVFTLSSCADEMYKLCNELIGMELTEDNYEEFNEKLNKLVAQQEIMNAKTVDFAQTWKEQQ